MNNEREIVLDTETTGLSPYQGHKIVEIGAVEIINKIPTGNNFHYYINPCRDMPIEAYNIHGISEEFLQDKPKFNEIADDFLKFIGESRMVIHNAQFDIKFLNHELSLINKKTFQLQEQIDTLLIARKMFPGTRVNLDSLCKRFKVDNSNREYHGALKDSLLLAEVYIELSGGRQEKFSIRNDELELGNNINKITKEKNLLNKNNRIIMKATTEEMKLHNDKYINTK
ncbi:MAG TPA: DNA polymerase III subunit epsilon [Candidatus Megaira endosymbiont of Hartmannula sinica]|nr:DNA polymerase III subunit epsilon [Candidatus Megaera endosymbiont of Hartmannula sinica]